MTPVLDMGLIEKCLLELSGIELASRLECGTAWVNQHTQFLPNIPFGGAKLSGSGLQGGSLGLDELCQLQVISVAKQLNPPG